MPTGEDDIEYEETQELADIAAADVTGLPMEEGCIENEENEELEDAPTDVVSDIGDVTHPFISAPIHWHRHFPNDSHEQENQKNACHQNKLNRYPFGDAWRGVSLFFSRKAEGIITLYSPRARLNEYQSQVNSYLVTQVRCLK